MGLVGFVECVIDMKVFVYVDKEQVLRQIDVVKVFVQVIVYGWYDNFECDEQLLDFV